MRAGAGMVGAAIAVLGAAGAGRALGLETAGALAAGRAARVAVIEPQLAGRWQEALAAADAWRAGEPATAAAAGVEVLRGALLARLGLVEEARLAYRSQLGGAFDAHARLALAELEVAAGRPEEAVQLAASLLADAAPAALAARAVDALTASFAADHDCGSLAGATAWQLTTALGRRIALLRADCLLAAGEIAALRPLLHGLLAVQDGADLGAAERLLALDEEPVEAAAERLGQVLFAHRDFRGALPLLERAASGGTPAAGWATPYAAARSLFWLERYPEAAARFQELAAGTRLARDRADALYQAGRSLELAGDWAAAAARFADCAAAEPAGTWTPACHLAVLRLAWREGREEEALAAYQALALRRQWAESRGRAALFLASSDLVRGRVERAASWLDAAAATAPPAEVAYWRGRLAELSAAPESAVARYRQAILADPYNLFAEAARARLASPALAAAALAAAEAATAAGSRGDLLAALRLGGPADPTSPSLVARLRESWLVDARAAALANLAPLPPTAWALWDDPDPTPAERLVALGLWEADREALARAFPAAPPTLALTRAALLATTRQARDAVRLAEGLAREAPDGFPEELLSPTLRRLLHPRPFREAVEREVAARQVDPLLLYALMREESRFDPNAVSPAAAHGLTQFVLPTARRFAAAVGRAHLGLADLHRPEVAIALGAAYLAELDGQFAGERHAVLAAYNAGEPQARLWQSYCFSREAPEYASKIGFRQTRDYVRKVLRGWAVYRELYADSL